jgi:hypothetical protein
VECESSDIAGPAAYFTLSVDTDDTSRTWFGWWSSDASKSLAIFTAWLPLKDTPLEERSASSQVTRWCRSVSVTPMTGRDGGNSSLIEAFTLSVVD